MLQSNTKDNSSAMKGQSNTKWWEEKNPSYDWEGLYKSFPEVDFNELYNSIPKELIEMQMEELKDVR